MSVQSRPKLFKQSEASIKVLPSNELVKKRPRKLESLYQNEMVSRKYEGNSISNLQIQVATYVFELNAGNCHR